MEFINPKKIFGLGTGSTVNFLIQKIHESYILKGQPINAVSTSRNSNYLAVLQPTLGLGNDYCKNKKKTCMLLR